MHTRKLLIPAAAALAVAAAPVALAAGGTTAPRAAERAAAPRIADVDADLRFDGRVLLEAETAGASRVTFTYRGRTVKAQRGGFDREDGTRDWYRTVRARGNDAAGNVMVDVKVRACKAGACDTVTDREHLEREDDD